MQFKISGADKLTSVGRVRDLKHHDRAGLHQRQHADAGVLQQAAREFAKAELANHRYVMVLHTQ